MIKLSEHDLFRFTAKVLVERETGCWLWTSATSNGYGDFTLDGKTRKAHRIAYELKHGLIPADGPGYHGWCVCHRCDQPLCVNPDHLFLGSAADNAADMVSKNRQAAGDKNGARLHPASRARGERFHRSRITADDVRDIRSSTATQQELGHLYGVSQSAISRIQLRKSCKHVEDGV